MPSDGVDRIVEQWAGERPDLDTTAMAVFGRIFRIARLSGDAPEQVYRRFDISRPEFDVLATLRRSGARTSLSPGALASSMMLSSGGTTARLDRLERAGLVTARPTRTTGAARSSASRTAGSRRWTPRSTPDWRGSNLRHALIPTKAPPTTDGGAPPTAQRRWIRVERRSRPAAPGAAWP